MNTTERAVALWQVAGSVLIIVRAGLSLVCILGGERWWSGLGYVLTAVAYGMLGRALTLERRAR